MDASKLLTDYKVVPVVVVNDTNRALRLAEVFLRNDLNCIEVTLRTDNALACIEAIGSAFPEAVMGAGSVVTPTQLAAAKDAGIAFAVSPGSSIELLKAATSTPLVPGAATASEVMNLKSVGYHTVKFFPAELLGGIKMLRALSEPIPGVQFFPTGGIRESNLNDYLNFNRVSCVGGSWLAPTADIENDSWAEITKRCESVKRILAAG